MLVLLVLGVVVRSCWCKFLKFDYFIGFFFQMLYNKYVMVRVGGGWEIFVGYLFKYDFCRMLQIFCVDGKIFFVQSKFLILKDMNFDNYLVVFVIYKVKKEIK